MTMSSRQSSKSSSDVDMAKKNKYKMKRKMLDSDSGSDVQITTRDNMFFAKRETVQIAQEASCTRRIELCINKY